MQVIHIKQTIKQKTLKILSKTNQKKKKIKKNIKSFKNN
jgi:hypothetical protein